MAERNFFEVVNKIMLVAPQRLAELLERKAPYWAPESRWENLSAYVNLHVRPDSKDISSLVIYSELLGIDVKEMKERFEAEGV